MDLNSLNFTQAQVQSHGLQKEGPRLVYKDSTSVSLFNPSDDIHCIYNLKPDIMKQSMETVKIPILLNNRYIEIDGIKLTAFANMNYTNLAAIHMTLRIPEINVLDDWKDQVEIALTYNPVDNSWIKIEEKWGSKIFDTLDNRTQDTCVETYQAKNIDDKLDFAGNNDDLINWKTNIPSKEAESTILWSFYIGGTNTSLPLFLITEGVSFSIYLRNKITDLLRMRIKTEEGYWKILAKPDLKYLGIFDNNATFSDIEISGTYFDRLPVEIDEIFNSAINCNGPIMVYKTYTFSSDKGLDEIKPKEYGESVSFKPQLSAVSKLIIATAENIDSIGTNLRSNYTTNPIDIRNGMSPIGDIIVKNKLTKEEIVYTPSIRRRYMQMFLPRMPKIKGHEFIFYSINPVDPTDVNGISLASNNIKIVVKLTSPPNNSFNSCKFRVSLRIQIVRTVKFTFNCDPKDKDARRKIKWEIE